jgi:hypothetical protein
VIDAPFGRVPEKASRWDLSGTELAKAKKVFRGLPRGFLDVDIYIGEELGQTEPGTYKPARRPLEVRPGGLGAYPPVPGSLSKLLVFLFCQESYPESFAQFGLRLMWIFCKTKIGQKTSTDSGH